MDDPNSRDEYPHFQYFFVEESGFKSDSNPCTARLVGSTGV